ncbi:Csu type fimbrial protein [Roseateles chitosanitabidus]|uniref:Csu type fimbrial protein n=1 Tax=Roseateles chitosanitabidus TaxID=65048 RepID=UPI0008350107|nr:spore coat U domain-containing protein [Roseateles chitosanitabidus]
MQGRILFLAALLSGYGDAVLAGTSTNTLSSQTTVTTACNVSGSTLSFGNTIDPIGTVPVDATSTLTVECTNTTPFTLSLSAGLNAGGITNFSQRKLKNGSYTLGYQLYTDAARTAIWGDGTSGSTTYGGNGTGGLLTVYIYGRLPSLTGTIPGTYTDTVTVTITY